MVCIRRIKEPTRRQALIKTLLKFKPDINLQDNTGQTAFTAACITGQQDTLNLLLLQSALDVNLPDRDGFTGFMYACEKGNRDIIDTLKDAHVKRKICINLDQVNDEGKTALDIAKERGDSNVVSSLNELYLHKNYTKPLSANTETSQQQTQKPRDNGWKTDEQTKRRNLSRSAVRRVIKEVMSDEEEEKSKANGEEDIDLSDLVKAFRECATDIKQIYKEEEKIGKETKEKFKELHEQETTETMKKDKRKGKSKYKDRGPSREILNDPRNRDSIEQKLKYPIAKNKINSPFVHPPPNPRFVHPRQNAFSMPKPPVNVTPDDDFVHPPPSKVVMHPPPKGINVEGIRLQTNEPERRIVLSDTSNYDKHLAQKPKKAPVKNNSVFKPRTNRHLNVSNLPFEVNGKQNRLAVKLPNRKIWSSLDQSNIDISSLQGHSSDLQDLQLPPVKECFTPRGNGNNPVKSHDKGMWKIIESYKT